jgi:HK97 family phage prohead protease
LQERKSRGFHVPMHLMHGVLGGDGLPVGVWKDMSEDSLGLHVKGKISGMNTDGGRLLYERVKDGALGGISIGYRVRPNGASFSHKSAKRVLNDLDIKEISLVADPSNPKARVLELKAIADSIAGNIEEYEPGIDQAVDHVVSAITHLDRLMEEQKSSPKDFILLVDDLRNAHKALTGEDAPMWVKSIPPLRVIERGIRDEFRVSHTKARAIAARWLDQLPREEGEKKAADEWKSPLAGFSLPE